MRKLLVVTPQDYKGYSNFRLHHIVAQFKKRFDSLTVIYRYSITERKSLSETFRSLFLINTLVEREDNIKLIRVDPLLNRRHGMGLRMLNIIDPYTPQKLPKRLTREILGLMGLPSDLLLLPSLLCGYFLRLRENFDVVIGQGPWEVAFGYILKKLGRARLLVYDDRDYEPGFQSTNRLRRRLVCSLEKRMLQKADIVVSVGDMLAALRKDQAGVEPVVIPNGVAYNLFKKAQQKIPHPPTLLYMGYINPWAGLDLIVEALKKIKEEIPNIRLLIAGHKDIDYFKSLLNKVKENELEGNFAYLGKLSYTDLVNPLRESDIGLAVFRPIDLRKYAFSLKLIEYMAAGLPVLTTKGTQSENVVKKHDCGVAVDYAPEAVADGLIKMLTDSDRYLQLSGNAKRAAAEYDWQTLMERYFNLIMGRL